MTSPSRPPPGRPATVVPLPTLHRVTTVESLADSMTLGELKRAVRVLPYVQLSIYPDGRVVATHRARSPRSSFSEECTGT